MEKWVEIRRRVLTKEISKRGACQEYGLQWRTLERILKPEEPAGYQLKEPRRKRKLDKFLPMIHEILKRDDNVLISAHIERAVLLLVGMGLKRLSLLPSRKDCHEYCNE